jgi:thyrotropin-releasing hormone receptor
VEKPKVKYDKQFLQTVLFPGFQQVVKMLVMVVVIFAVLWLPYRGLVVYNSFAPMFGKEVFMDLWFLMLAKTCVYINR